MKIKRLIRGGRREYRKHGISAIPTLVAWYASRKVAPSLWSLYYIEYCERDVEEYDVPIDPYEVTWVDPDEIVYKSNRETQKWASFASNLGSVKGGTWDQNVDEEFSSRHSSFKAHFEDGVPWEDTQLYREALKAISKGEYTMRMATTEEEILQRCYEIDDLYDKMKEEGYRSQEELGTYDSKLQRLGNEIQVDVGRDGSLLFVEGRHRLSIAKILDVDAVPVIVVCRHEGWMEYLEDRYRRGVEIDHPDWNTVE